jgi:PPOX class probable F420-dependent enzyme
MRPLDLSDPDQAEADRRLRSQLVIWLVTVAPSGQPQPTPVWFLWDGDGFRVYSRPQKPKLRNITANARVGLHLRGTELGDDIVIVEGEARLDPDGPSADEVPAYVEKYRGRIEGMGWTPASFAADYSEPIRIDPLRVRIW